MPAFDIHVGSSLDFFLENLVELAFLHILFMWVLHCRSSEMVMPKYGFDDTCWSIVLSSW